MSIASPYEPPPHRVVLHKKHPCEECGEEILPEERCANVFIGKAGVGPKSGQPMVVDSEEMRDMGISHGDVHLRCLQDYAWKMEAFVDHHDGVEDAPDPEADDSVCCIHCGVLIDIRACCAGCDDKLNSNWG